MTAQRSLPIRVQPIAGEALDSWLEAFAHRSTTAFADLLSAVGLKPDNGAATTTWIAALTHEQSAAISSATGVGADRLAAMTLTHYADRAVRIDPQSRRLDTAFPWGGARGSRYCPKCLRETGGRWQLSWRLGWTFACTQHRCLLADACPQCGAVPRRRRHVGELIPEPGRCSAPATSALGRAPIRCAADLTSTAVDVFDNDHPAVRAQRTVNSFLDLETIASGVYRIRPQQRFNVLCDIRAVAGRALSYGKSEELEPVIPADLLAAHYGEEHRKSGAKGIARTDMKPGLAAPARAATAAVGVVAALHVLDRDDLATAGEALRWLVETSRDRGLTVSPTSIGWGKNTSPVLTGVQLTALAPWLNPSDQLRYRVGSSLPTRPLSIAAGTSASIRHAVPTMLWQEVSLRLAIPNCHQRRLRPALSSLVTLINSRGNLDDAAGWLAAPITGHAVSRVAQLLESNDKWSGIRTALIRLADYLAETAIPINYERRRRLDYAALLPDNVWKQFCRDTATPGPRAARARIARCFLFEKISTLPATLSPFWVDTNLFQTTVADFPQYLTPELNGHLDEHARTFLAEHGITSEPLVWHPPTSMFDGIDLPGQDPTTIDLAALHELVAHEKASAGSAADRLGLDIETVRYLLATYPTPRPLQPPGTRARPGQVYREAKDALSAELMTELYQNQRLSLRDIAARVGADRKAIAELARDYGIPLREPQRTAKNIIERDWLYERYVNQHRTLPDIAAEAGMSTPNMARWAKKHGIPMRSRGGVSHAATLAAETNNAKAPARLRPALAGIGGYQRLERFVAASQYRTLTIAAERLGTSPATLIAQINRVERELGSKLFERAQRGHPLRLTDDGALVVAAFRGYQARRGN